MPRHSAISSSVHAQQTPPFASYHYVVGGIGNGRNRGKAIEKDAGKAWGCWAWGRFLSTDPLTGKYPELTPYQFASNTPIEAVDIDGLEGGHSSITDGYTVIQAVDNTRIVKLIEVYEFQALPTPRQEFIGPAYDRLQPERPSLFDQSPLFSEHFIKIGSQFKESLKKTKLTTQLISVVAKGYGTDINNNLVSGGYRYMSAVGSDVPMNGTTDLAIRLRQLSTSPKGGTGLVQYGKQLGKWTKRVAYIGVTIDTYDYLNDNISGYRYSYNVGSVVAGIAVGVRFGGPWGFTASTVLTGGQFLYDKHQEAKLAPQPEPDFRSFDEKVNDGFEQLEDLGKNPNSSDAPF